LFHESEDKTQLTDKHSHFKFFAEQQNPKIKILRIFWPSRPVLTSKVTETAFFDEIFRDLLHGDFSVRLKHKITTLGKIYFFFLL